MIIEVETLESFKATEELLRFLVDSFQINLVLVQKLDLSLGILKLAKSTWV